MEAWEQVGSSEGALEQPDLLVSLALGLADPWGRLAVLGQFLSLALAPTVPEVSAHLAP